MAAATPQSKSITRLLRGLQGGLNNWVARRQAPAEEEESEDGDVSIVGGENDENVARAANIGGNDNNVTNLSTPHQQDMHTVIPTSGNDVNNGDSTMSEKLDSRKLTARPKARKNSNKQAVANDVPKQNSGSNATSEDPAVPTVPNPYDLEAGFGDGYDTDGWEGPPIGTCQDEIEEAKEPSIKRDDQPRAPTDSNVDAVEEGANPTTAVHVPIAEEDLKKMTIAQLKEELKKRKVPLKGLSNKAAFVGKLQEALQHQLPVFSEEQLAAQEKKEKEKNRKPDNMSCFPIGAYWKALEPTVDVEEPVNEGFQDARGPQVLKENAGVPPMPKKQFVERFDRPVFTGRVTTRVPRQKADGTTGYDTQSKIREKGGPKPSFLEKHRLNKDSSPVELVDAFFPMYANRERDANGDPHVSMEVLAFNTNLRATLASAGEVSYSDWSGPFSVKELRQYLGLYVLNGLSPSPGLERKFNDKDAANYNQFIAHNLGKNAPRRLRQFRCFFTCQDPRKVTPDRIASPLFKVLPVIKWIRKVGPLSWECGIHLARP